MIPPGPPVTFSGPAMSLAGPTPGMRTDNGSNSDDPGNAPP